MGTQFESQTEVKDPSVMKLLSVGIFLALLFQTSYGLPTEPSLKSLHDAVQSKLFDGLVKQVTDGQDKDLLMNGPADMKTVFTELQELVDILNYVKEDLSRIAYHIEEDYRKKIANNLISKDLEGLKETVREMAKEIIVAFNDEMIKHIVGNGNGDDREWREDRMIKWSLPDGEDCRHCGRAIYDYVEDCFGVMYSWIIYTVKGGMNEMVVSITDQGGKNMTKVVEDIRVGMSMGNMMVDFMERPGPGLLGELIHNNKPFVFNEVNRYIAAAKIRGWNRVAEIQKAHIVAVDFMKEFKEKI